MASYSKTEGEHLKCACCNKDIFKTFNQMNTCKILTCSRKCYNNLLYKDKRIKTNCFICNKELKYSLSEFNKGVNHLCSRECKGVYLREIKSKKVVVKCHICQKEVTRPLNASKRSKYFICSDICKAELNKIRYKGFTNPKSLKLNEVEMFFYKKTQNCKLRACVKKIEFNLDFKFLIELYEKQRGLCFYSGIPLKITGTDKDYDTLSIDRVDSSKGYTKDNIVLCSLCMNTMKMDYKLEDFEKVLDSITNKRRN